MSLSESEYEQLKSASWIPGDAGDVRWIPPILRTLDEDEFLSGNRVPRPRHAIWKSPKEEKMSESEEWRDLRTSAGRAYNLAGEVTDLARQIIDRLGEIYANTDQSTDLTADTAWCREVAASMFVARMVLQVLSKQMREEWR